MVHQTQLLLILTTCTFSQDNLDMYKTCLIDISDRLFGVVAPVSWDIVIALMLPSNGICELMVTTWELVNTI